MMVRLVLLLLSVALVATACGSDKDSGSSTLPDAATTQEWAQRVVNRLLKPMNRDLETLATLNNVQTKLYIQQGNQDTLDVLNERMTDLGKCTERLDTIGPPPTTDERSAELKRIETGLREACRHYVKVSELVLVAVELLSSGRSDVIPRGEAKLREAVPEATAGAAAYDRAFKIAQRFSEFQLQGLTPPA
jgi:hypothetical protein